MRLLPHVRRTLLGAASVLMLALPQTAAAEGFDLQQFNPMPNLSGNLFSTASADVAPHLEWSALALFNYANDPLILQDNNGDRLESLVQHQANLHLLFSLGLFDLVDIGVDVPLTVWQEGSSVPGGGITPEDGSFGVGDLRLVPKVRLFSTRANERENGVALALLADVYIPTGDDSRLQGGDFRIGPRLAFDAILGGTRLAANVGYLYREEQQIRNLTVRDTLSWNVGAEVPLHEKFRITGEVFGRLTPGADSIERYNSPTEFLAGAKYQTGRFFATAGGGAGLINGYGTPDWRLFAGLGFVPPRFTEEPAPEPVYEPECTQENVEFTCIDIPATSCTDGVLRTHYATCANDACAYQATEITCAKGTRCGEDESGQAACVPEPDCSVDGDCANPPANTCTDNVLTTYAGQCKDESCHYEPVETPCAERMECGLDQGKAACVPVVDEVVVKGDRIEILNIVHFAHNSDEIEERSFNLLQQVAQVLKSHPEIKSVRIEGHTDATGRRAYNMDLSERRAASVRSYLILQGIDGERLTSQGFGPDRPVQTNNTEKGRAANRRVEFHIVERD